MATLPERPDFEAGYQAVYDSGALTHDVYRNAAIWHAVQAALKAALPSDAAIQAARAKELKDAANDIEPDSDVDPETVTTIFDPYDVGDWLRARAASIEQTEANHG